MSLKIMVGKATIYKKSMSHFLNRKNDQGTSLEYSKGGNDDTSQRCNGN